MDLQTSAAAVQHRDASVLAAVRDAARSCNDTGLGARIGALHLALSQGEAALAAALWRADAAASHNQALLHQLEVRCH